MGQKEGEKWTAAVDLQPTLPKSASLLAPALVVTPFSCKTGRLESPEKQSDAVRQTWEEDLQDGTRFFPTAPRSQG
jgi:hypothetical protein